MRFNIIIILLVLNSCQCLKTTDYCSLTKTECGINKLNCYCEGKFSHKCRGNYCSNSKSNCYKYQFYFSLILNRKGAFNLSNVNNYQMFTSRIQKCSQLKQSTQAVNVCHKENKCYFKKGLPFRAGNMFMLFLKICPCSGVYSKDCGNQFCGLNDTDCVHSTVYLKSAKEIKKCAY